MLAYKLQLYYFSPFPFDFVTMLKPFSGRGCYNQSKISHISYYLILRYHLVAYQ